MEDATRITLDDVRSTASDLAAALGSSGATAAAGVLVDALGVGSAEQPDELLELRSALVRTRAEWHGLADSELVGRARAALAAAKRLSIEQ